MIIRFIVILVFAIVLTCCGGQPDPRLEEVERLISVSPREAMDSLDAIRYDRLSSYDKEYYDFLMVNRATRRLSSTSLTALSYGLFPMRSGIRVGEDMQRHFITADVCITIWEITPQP